MANSKSTDPCPASTTAATDAPLSSAERQRSYSLENVADALYYLERVVPLVGCDFTDDDELIAGRSEVLRLIGNEVRRLAWPESRADQVPTESAASVDEIIECAFASAFNEATRARTGDDIMIGTATEEFIAAWHRVADERARTEAGVQ